MRAPRSLAAFTLTAAFVPPTSLPRDAGAAPAPAEARGHHRSAATPAAPAPAVAGAAADQAPPRLARDAMPTAETVDLVLDPEQAEYRGRVTIDLAIPQGVREVRF